MRAAVLAIDQGTTNTKVLLVDEHLEILASGSSAVPLDLPRPAWFEQDADVIWGGVLAAVRQCLEAAPDVTLAGMTVSAQRESVVAWDKSGRPLTPVIGWQDGRTAKFCATLASQGADAQVRARTGLRLDPMFSAPKMRWILDSLRSSGRSLDDVCLGTIDAFLVHRLTGGATFTTEIGCASRTLLLDIEKRDWAPELLDMFGVPDDVLPEVRGSTDGFGVTVANGPLPAGVPILAVLGDSHAALYAHGCRAPGTAKATYGTGSSIMAPTFEADMSSRRLSTTVAWQIDEPVAALEGNILATGAALDGVARLIGADNGEGVAKIAATASSGELVVVPAYSGLASPHWDRDAVGVVVGLARETSPAQLARAALEAVAHQVCDVVDVLDQEAVSPAELHADGGGSKSAVLMQTQADLLGRPVLASSVPELSAVGVVALAQDAGKVDRSRTSVSTETTVYEPRLDADRRSQARSRWRDAVRRSRGQDVGR